ncbi:MAG: hypothetical protein ACRD01_06065 [Terriglobales bacterium]
MGGRQRAPALFGERATGACTRPSRLVSIGGRQVALGLLREALVTGGGRGQPGRVAGVLARPAAGREPVWRDALTLVAALVLATAVLAAWAAARTAARVDPARTLRCE